MCSFRSTALPFLLSFAEALSASLTSLPLLEQQQQKLPPPCRVSVSLLRRRPGTPRVHHRRPACLLCFQPCPAPCRLRHRPAVALLAAAAVVFPFAKSQHPRPSASRLPGSAAPSRSPSPSTSMPRHRPLRFLHQAGARTDALFVLIQRDRAGLLVTACVVSCSKAQRALLLAVVGRTHG